MASRKLEVQITGDSKNLDRALGKAETRLQKFGRKADTLSAGTSLSGRGGLGASAAILKGGGLALAAGAVGSEALKAVSAASDLNEQISKSNVVFGSSAAAITSWSKDLATSFGLAQTQALEAASTFGALFKNTGASAFEAATLSKSVVQLGADLASFNNTSVDDALLALRSGLSGEIEPLRRFQVFLTEASVQQEAMAETGKKSASQLTQGEKILARYKLIMRQTTQAQGDFGRTSGGLANQQRILQAQTKNLEANLGKGLLPVMIELTKQTNFAVGAISKLGSAIGKLNTQLPGGGSTGGALKDALFLGPNVIQSLLRGKDAVKDLGDALATTSQLAAQFQQNVGGINLNPSGNPTIGNPNPAAPTFPNFGTTARNPRPGASASQRNQFFDNAIARRLDRVQDIGSLSGQITALQGIKGTIATQIAKTKDVTRRLNLGDEVAQINRQIKGLNDEIAQNLKDSAAALKDARQKTADALRAQAEKLKQQASDIKSAVLDAFDTKSKKIDNARALQDAKKLFAQAQKLGDKGGLQIATRGLVDARRAVQRQRLEDTTFRVSAGRPGPSEALQIGNVTINVNSNQSPEQIAKQVLKVMQKRTRQGGSQTRGTIAGRNFNAGIY